ncbi:MAG: carbon storage regulator [Firmicutes bacterium]|nr:carbon storage regulator [Bacillota bacterium]NBI63835.1 carbon storage regulator [Clostridiales bacterium]
MLVLYRKRGDSILIGEDITLTVIESSGDGVRLAIDAPRDVAILRKELLEAAEVNREAAKADAANKKALLKMNEILKKKEHN